MSFRNSFESGSLHDPENTRQSYNITSSWRSIGEKEDLRLIAFKNEAENYKLGISYITEFRGGLMHDQDQFTGIEFGLEEVIDVMSAFDANFPLSERLSVSQQRLFAQAALGSLLPSLMDEYSIFREAEIRNIDPNSIPKPALHYDAIAQFLHKRSPSRFTGQNWEQCLDTLVSEMPRNPDMEHKPFFSRYG